MKKLNEYFQDVMNRYKEARIGEEFKGHHLGELMRHELPNYIESLEVVDEQKFSVKGTIGAGVWTLTPWIAILSKEIEVSMQNGVYIVYLFSEDMDTVYLTLNQGVTDYFKNVKKNRLKETIQHLESTGESLRKYFNDGKVILNNDIDLGNGTQNSKLYEKGTIAYIPYKKDNLPDEDEMIEDLKIFIDSYKAYIEDEKQKMEKEIANRISNTGVDHVPKPNGGDLINSTINGKELVEHVHEYVQGLGFNFSLREIKNFYLSLKTKPFVLLAGISGTGKSKLVELFARALGANEENREFNLIPVRPDWSDPTELLGYRNLEGNFQPGPLTKIISEASKNLHRPYFVCLDEMNLARVEYYFSDLLSIMETRRKMGEEIWTNRIFSGENFGKEALETQEYEDLRLPENLYIVGTVNMDETTFPFSKKVLDRANTMEFNYVDLIVDFDALEREEVEPINGIDNNRLGSKYLTIKDLKGEQEHVEKTVEQLDEINQILKKVGHQFGYRIRDEILFYTLYAKKEGIFEENTALDHSIKQKILPRLQGSHLETKEVLIDLFVHFTKAIKTELDPYDQGIYEKMKKQMEERTVQYPLSAIKVAEMTRRFEAHGFTSFWE